MNGENHRIVHKELHNSLNRLIGDFVYHNGDMEEGITVMKLRQWSFTQTLNPTDVREEADDANE